MLDLNVIHFAVLQKPWIPLTLPECRISLKADLLEDRLHQVHHDVGASWMHKKMISVMISMQGGGEGVIFPQQMQQQHCTAGRGSVREAMSSWADEKWADENCDAISSWADENWADKNCESWKQWAVEQMRNEQVRIAMHGSNGQLSRCRILRIVRESAMSTGCSLRGKQLQQLGRLVGFRC